MSLFFGHEITYDNGETFINVDNVCIILPGKERVDFVFMSDTYPGRLGISCLQGGILYVDNPTASLEMWTMFWAGKPNDKFAYPGKKELTVSGSVL